MNGFGPHLMIDASGCDRTRLVDYEFVYELLSKLPEKIDMTAMTLPYVVKWMDQGATIPGISGFVMIAESHISIHTFPEKNYVFIDIFSCRNFDVEKASKILSNAFKPANVDKHIVKRGRLFPRLSAEAMY